VTCRLRVVGESGPATWVVKAAPPGRPAVGRHDVLRQARILRLLNDIAGIEVPAVGLEHAGAETFFLMSWHEGDSAEPVLDRSPHLDAATALSRAKQAAAMLTALHAVDPAALELGAEAVLTPLDELDRWAATMSVVAPDLCEGAGDVETQLRKQVPPPITSRLVHGDFRLGNTLSRGADVLVIIDWEIWAVGDPRVDLAWFLLFCDADNFPAVGDPHCAMPTAETVRASYADASRADLTALRWFDVLARYKMAAVMAHNLGRHRSGKYVDPSQEALVPAIRAMLASALNTIADGPLA
jgi:aminoglycoside phosphotransferase (APT) family kinase protein